MQDNPKSKFSKLIQVGQQSGNNNPNSSQKKDLKSLYLQGNEPSEPPKNTDFKAPETQAPKTASPFGMMKDAPAYSGESKPNTQDITPTTPVQQASINPDPVKPVNQGSEVNPFSSYLNIFSKRIANTPADLGEGWAIASAFIERNLGKIGVPGANKNVKASDIDTYKLADNWRKWMDEVYPSNKKDSETFLGGVVDGLGQVVPLVLSGGSSASTKMGLEATKLGTNLTPYINTGKEIIKRFGSKEGILAGSQIAAPTYKQALQEGASEDQALQYAIENMTVGSVVENLPIQSMFSRIAKLEPKAQILNIIKEGFVGGGEEAVTEMWQSTYENMSANRIYDTNKQVFEGIGDAGSVGGTVGFILNAATTALIGKRARTTNPQEKEVLDKSIQELEQKQEQVEKNNEQLAKNVKALEVSNVLGEGIGPKSFGNTKQSNKIRRKEAGSLYFAKDKNGNTVEIIGEGKEQEDGSLVYPAINKSGKTVNISENELDDVLDLDYDTFNGILDGKLSNQRELETEGNQNVLNQANAAIDEFKAQYQPYVISTAMGDMLTTAKLNGKDVFVLEPQPNGNVVIQEPGGERKITSRNHLTDVSVSSFDDFMTQYGPIAQDAVAPFDPANPIQIGEAVQMEGENYVVTGINYDTDQVTMELEDGDNVDVVELPLDVFQTLRTSEPIQEEAPVSTTSSAAEKLRSIFKPKEEQKQDGKPKPEAVAKPEESPVVPEEPTSTEQAGLEQPTPEDAQPEPVNQGIDNQVQVEGQSVNSDENQIENQPTKPTNEPVQQAEPIKQAGQNDVQAEENKKDSTQEGKGQKRLEGSVLENAKPNAKETASPDGTADSGTTGASKTATEQARDEGVYEKARKQGFVEKNGVRYDRQSALKPVKGKEIKLEFAKDINETGNYVVIEADQLQPSHRQGNVNPLHFIPEAQPKNRKTTASKESAIQISQKLDPDKLAQSPNPYSGAPAVNSRGEVIQGNNRSDAILQYWNGNPQDSQGYKQYLIDRANELGLNADEVSKLKKPVLVRMVPVSDARSIELGNYDVKDIESGGNRRIEPVQTVNKLNPDDRAKLITILGDSNGNTLPEIIREKVGAITKLLYDKGAINSTQLETIINPSTGYINPAGIEDISNLFRQFLFDGGDTSLPELFESIPDRVKKGLEKAIPNILNAPKSIIKEIQESIMALNQYMTSGVQTFQSWTGQADMFMGGQSPRDIYNLLGMELAKRYDAAKTQSEITNLFREYEQLTKDQAGDMFNGPTAGISSKEAIKKVFNIDYEPSNQKPKQGSDNQAERPIESADQSVQKGEQSKPASKPRRAGDLLSTNQNNQSDSPSVKPETQPESGTGKKSENDSGEAVKSKKKESKTAKPEPKTPSIASKDDFQDVGEKIGGAKKDTYSKQTANLELNTVQRLADEPLSKTVPEPNYKQLVEDGLISEDDAISLKMTRELLGRKPNKGYKLNRWVAQAKIYSEWMEKTLKGEPVVAGKSLSEVISLARKAQNGDLGLRRWAEEVDLFKKLNWISTGNTPGPYQIKGDGDQRYIVKGQYIVSGRGNERMTFDEAAEWIAITRLKEQAKTNESGGKLWKFKAFQDRRTGDIFIERANYPGIRIKQGFTNSKEVHAYIKNNYKDLVEAFNQLKDIPDDRRVENNSRIGKDHRNGKNISSAEEFMETFGFRGVEFGNWVNAQERQDSINKAYDALMDMAMILKIPAKAIGLNGELGLAFGARGRKGAAAHYEPAKRVINLTKESGAGSLAHEWWHGFDNYLSRRRNEPGGYLSERPREFISNSSDPKGFDQDQTRKEIFAAFKAINKVIERPGGQWERSQQRDKFKSKKYYQQPREMTARAFESYVIDRLATQDTVNDYLANIAKEEDYPRPEVYPYPTQSEKNDLFGGFDQLFNIMKVDESSPKKPLYMMVQEGADVTEVKEGQNISRPKMLIIGEQGASALDKTQDATIRLDNLSTAREMENNGKSRESIRLATGWERGADSKWRYEIQDGEYQNPSKVLDMLLSKYQIITKLSDFYTNKEFYEAYPKAKDIQVTFDPFSSGGKFDVGSLKLTIGTESFRENYQNTPKEEILKDTDNLRRSRSVLAHELTHYVQTQEGFAAGSSPNYFSQRQALTEAQRLEFQEYNVELEALLYEAFSRDLSISEAFDIAKEIYSPKVERNLSRYVEEYKDKPLSELAQRVRNDRNYLRSPLQKYYATAGEVEARNVQNRLDMNPEERLYQTLLSTEMDSKRGGMKDVAREDQIFLTDVDLAMSISNPQTETKAFKDWFGDSKVVDADGNPLVVYHGTDADFNSFKNSRGDVGMHFGTIGQANDRIDYQREGGIKTADGMNLMPVYLSIKKPLRMPDTGLWNADNMNYILEDNFPNDKSRIKGLKTSKQIKDYLISKGYDGIVYQNTGEVRGSEPYREAIRIAKENMKRVFPKWKNSFNSEDQKVPEYIALRKAESEYIKYREENGEDSYIAFSPTQIKSATGNQGTFDSKNPDIRYTKAGNLLNQNTVSTKKQAVSTVTKEAERITKNWKNAPEIKVFPDGASIEAAYPAVEFRDLGRVPGLFYDNQVILNASHPYHQTPGGTEALILHESLGHYGLGNLINEQAKSKGTDKDQEYAKLMQSVFDRYKDSEMMSYVAKTYWGKSSRTLTEEQQIEAGEEFIAHTVQTGVQDKFIDRVIAKIRQILRDLGFSMRMTDAELRAIIGRATRFVVDGPAQAGVRGSMVRAMSTDQQENRLLDVVDGFYSPIEKRLLEFKQPKASATKWKEIVGKKDEAQWTGVYQYLDGLKPDQQVTKQELLDWMKNNRVEIKIVDNTQPNINEEKQDIKEELSRYGYYIDQDMSGELGVYTMEDDSLVDPDDLDEEVVLLINAYEAVSDGVNDNTKFSQYQLEGDKTDYKEVLVTLPTKRQKATVVEHEGKWRIKHIDGSLSPAIYISKNFAEKDLSEYVKREKTGESFDSDTFKSSHFDEPNILVHLRMNTRTDAEGNKVLFLEEIQSDWGQEGKKKGFKSELERGERYREEIEKHEGKKVGDIFIQGNDVFYTALNGEYLSAPIYNGKIEMEEAGVVDERGGNYHEAIRSIKGQGIPTAPFVTDTNSWVKLGLKVALKEAVAQGADRIAWTTGTQQNERYDLSKKVSAVYYDPARKILKADDLQGDNIIDREGVEPNQIEDFVGKEVATKLISDNVEKTSKGWNVVKGLDLKIGGTGMKAFYGDPSESNIGIIGRVAESIVGRGSVQPLNISEDGQVKIDAFQYDGTQDVEGLPGTDYLKNGEWIITENGSPVFIMGEATNQKEAIRNYREAIDSNGDQDVIPSGRGVGIQHSIPVTLELINQVESGQPMFMKTPEGSEIRSNDFVPEQKKTRIQNRLENDPNFLANPRYMVDPAGVESTSVENQRRKDFLQAAKSFFDTKNPVSKTKRTSGRIAIQDAMLPGKRLLESKFGKNIPEEQDFYTKENLAADRIVFQVGQMEKKYMEPIKQLTDSMQDKYDLSFDQIEDYLAAKHNQERRDVLIKENPEDAKKYINDPEWPTGMTQEEADRIKKDFESKVDKKDRDQLAKLVKDMVNFSLEKRRESGLISQQYYEALKDQYDFYVPLRGWQDHIEYDPTKYSPMKKAKGRKSKAASPLSYLYADAADAIAHGERNKVFQSFLEFAKKNPDSNLFQIKTSYYRKSKKEDGSQLWIEMNEEESRPSQEEIKKGTVIRGFNPAIMRDVALNKPGDLSLTVYVNGQKVSIQFAKDQEQLVKALKHTAYSNIEGFIKLSGKFNRYLSSAFTEYSPEFGFTNAARDFGMGTFSIIADDGFDTWKKTASKYRTSMIELYSHFFAGQDLTKSKNPYLNEFMESGAFTGFSQVKEVKDIYKDLSGKSLGKKLSDTKFAKLLSTHNKSIENSLRYAYFQTLREQGLSIQQAAIKAKDVTVNFRRRGNMTSNIGALYAFFNAGVQGVEKFTRPFFSNDKSTRRKAQAMVGTLFVSGFMQGMLHNLFGGIGDEEDELLYDNIPDYTKAMNMVIPFPNESGYFLIPLGYGINVPYALGELLSQVVLGKKKKSEAIWTALTISSDSFSPMGGYDFGDENRTMAERMIQFALPTYIKPVGDLAINSNFAGFSIVPEKPWEKGVPNSQNYTSNTNQYAIKASQLLNNATGGDDVVPGQVDINPTALEYLIRQYGGGPLNFAQKVERTRQVLFEGENPLTGDASRKVPFASRFYVDAENNSSVTSKYFKSREQIQIALDRYDKYLNKQDISDANRFYDENKGLIDMEGYLKSYDKDLKSLAKDMQSVRDSNPELFKKLEKQRNDLMSEFNQIFRMNTHGEQIRASDLFR